MGLFSHKPVAAGITPMGRVPVVAKAPEAPPATNEDDDTEDSPKKVYGKEKAPKKKPMTDVPETETDKNTRLNALLFHTSDELVDLYCLENNLLDLLGRLYYDDYDSDVSGMSSTVMSPLPLAPANSDRGNAFLTVQKAAQRLRSPSPSKRPPLLRHSSFERGVSFDTLSDTHHQAITLKVKHPQFRFRRNNKTYLIGFSNDVESLRAVEWAFQEMVINGDTIIVLQVLDEKIYKSIDHELAEQVIAKLEKLNTHNKKISLVYEAVIGKPQKLLRNAIDEYKPAMMIVGTHDYEKAQLHRLSLSQNITDRTHPTHQPPTPHHKHRGLFSKASISKYFLQFALVPCIVVKPIYHYHENLDNPIDNERYFHDWIALIDVSHTREEKKKRSRLAMALSPSLSRQGSLTNLADMGKRERSPRPVNLDATFTFGSREPSPVLSPALDTDLSQESKTHLRLSRFFGH